MYSAVYVLTRLFQIKRFEKVPNFLSWEREFTDEKYKLPSIIGYWEAFRDEGCCLLNTPQTRAAAYLSSMERRELGWRSVRGIELVGVSRSS